jgi:hypothetical protein
MGDPLRPEDVTWEELRQHAEGSWRLLGPNSGGGTTLYRYKGQLFVVGYGDHSSLPGGAEQVIGVLPDNTPGFPPLMESGHAAGCAHERHFDWDWWQHGTLLLRVQRDGVLLYEDGKESWTCPLQQFLQADSPRRAEVLRKLGPAVLEEALQCAAARLGR